MNQKEKEMVARDMREICIAHNNILREDIYFQKGKYTKNVVLRYWQSFAHACRCLNLINPDDPCDIKRVLEDIKNVAIDNKGKVTKRIYEEYGIYNVEAIEKQYGKNKFNDLIIMAGVHKMKKETKQQIGPFYPYYKRQLRGRDVLIIWNYNYSKKIRSTAKK